MRCLLTFLVTAILLLSSPATSAAVAHQHQHPIGQRVVAYARRFLGTPFVWGGASPSGFDCSGLVMYVYQHFGISLPHSSFGDAVRGRPVSRPRQGDIVLFEHNQHVGIYVGSGSFISAPHHGDVVKIASINWWGQFTQARRLVS